MFLDGTCGAGTIYMEESEAVNVPFRYFLWSWIPGSNMIQIIEVTV